MTVTLLTDHGVSEVAGCAAAGEDLWLSEDGLLGATGFHREPEGLCRDAACFPLPYGREAQIVRDGEVNVAAFWRLRGGAVVASADRTAWVLGEPPAERAARMQLLEAPDFTLPDARGRMHSLSDYRGRKVLLATWASW